jgi:hypothetical protein
MSPRPCIPPPLVQRKASAPDSLALLPTTTEPSAETSWAVLWKLPPGSSPMLTIPPPLVQRKASRPDALADTPTATEPSAETPLAVLSKIQPGKSPRPVNIGPASALGAAKQETQIPHRMSFRMDFPAICLGSGMNFASCGIFRGVCVCGALIPKKKKRATAENSPLPCVPLTTWSGVVSTQFRGRTGIGGGDRVAGQEGLARIAWLRERGVPVILALTKSDKLKPMRRVQRVAAMRRAIGLPDDRVVATSAEKRLGLEDLWRAIDALL